MHVHVCAPPPQWQRHADRPVYSNRSQRSAAKLFLFFSARTQGWCIGRSIGANRVLAFVRSLAATPAEVSPANIWLVPKGGTPGATTAVGATLSFAGLSLAPDVEAKCLVRGALHGKLGALPGTYTRTYHATNRRGKKECRVAQRTVIVRPAKDD